LYTFLTDYRQINYYKNVIPSNSKEMKH